MRPTRARKGARAHGKLDNVTLVVSALTSDDHRGATPAHRAGRGAGRAMDSATTHQQGTPRAEFTLMWPIGPVPLQSSSDSNMKVRATTFGFEEQDPLAPKGSGFEREPFEAWWARAEPQLPNVPREVAREWVHRHWRNGPISPHVSLRELLFRLEAWDADQIERIGRSDRWTRGRDGVADMAHWESVPGYVPRFMLAHGKWPSPIIVGRTLSSFPSLAHLFSRGSQAQPILFEGHVRLEVWRSMREAGRGLSSPLPVWVAALSDP